MPQGPSASHPRLPPTDGSDLDIGEQKRHHTRRSSRRHGITYHQTVFDRGGPPISTIGIATVPCRGITIGDCRPGFARLHFGHTYFVHASDIAALRIRLGAAVRRRRLFHPNGVLAEGILERIAPSDEGLPMNSCDVIGRVSKGIGLPGALPDIAGLAWRIPPTPDLRSCMPWDILLASTVANSRVILAPTRSWSSSTFSSLMLFRFDGGVWWVRARLVTKIDEPGLSLEPIRNQIDSEGIDFDIEQAQGTGRFEPLARLTLRHLDPSRDDIAFDPALHCDEGVELVPRWLGDVRRAAYRHSREAQDAVPAQ
jgi:hypothetical protein